MRVVAASMIVRGVSPSVTTVWLERTTRLRPLMVNCVLSAVTVALEIATWFCACGVAAESATSTAATQISRTNRGVGMRLLGKKGTGGFYPHGRGVTTL